MRTGDPLPGETAAQKEDQLGREENREAKNHPAAGRERVQPPLSDGSLKRSSYRKGQSQVIDEIPRGSRKNGEDLLNDIVHVAPSRIGVIIAWPSFIRRKACIKYAGTDRRWTQIFRITQMKGIGPWIDSDLRDYAKEIVRL